MGFTTQAAGAAVSAYGASKAARTRKNAYAAQGQIDSNNAQIAEWQAAQAETAGAQQEQNARLRGAQVAGGQRAEMAANGIDLGSGSATDVLASTKLVNEIDALTIRDNATRTAWGYRTQGTNFTNDANMSASAADSINPGLVGWSSLLGNAGAVDASWTAKQKNGGWSRPSWLTSQPAVNSPRGGY